MYVYGISMETFINYFRYGVTNQEAMVVIMPELMITKHDKPYQVLEIKDDTETAEILVSYHCYLVTPLAFYHGNGSKEFGSNLV